jgi:heme A synthase
VLPRAEQVETLIEFSHRVSSGLALLAVIGLMIWAFRAYGQGHPVRVGASFSMLFMVTEALVGAGLVLFELVADNTSLARAIVMALHLINTFLLLGALTLTAWWASGGPPIRWQGQGALGWLLGLGLAGMLLLGASGGVTALGDTLFSATSLAEGLQQKFSPTAHLLVRLRLLHPLIAVIVGVYLIAVGAYGQSQRPTALAKNWWRLLTGLYLVQLAAGAINVVLLAPVWLQMVHLLLADLIWISLVLLVSTLLAQPVAVEPSTRSADQTRNAWPESPRLTR